MKNDLSNTAIAPVTELPDNVRIPLHSLQADLGYLIGRVIADCSCGPMVIKSMGDSLNQIEAAYTAMQEALERAQKLIEREYPNGQLAIDIRAVLTNGVQNERR